MSTTSGGSNVSISNDIGDDDWRKKKGIKKKKKKHKKVMIKTASSPVIMHDSDLYPHWKFFDLSLNHLTILLTYNLLNPEWDQKGQCIHHEQCSPPRELLSQLHLHRMHNITLVPMSTGDRKSNIQRIEMKDKYRHLRRKECIIKLCWNEEDHGETTIEEYTCDVHDRISDLRNAIRSRNHFGVSWTMVERSSPTSHARLPAITEDYSLSIRLKGVHIDLTEDRSWLEVHHFVSNLLMQNNVSHALVEEEIFRNNEPLFFTIIGSSHYIVPILFIILFILLWVYSLLL